MADQRRIDEFLDLYKQLEDELEGKYRNSRRHYSSVVFEFARDDDSLPVRDKLDICREIRNLLTHNPNLEGEPIVEPSQPVLRAIREVLEFVRRPPLAMDYATKADQVMKAHLGQRVLRLMEVMDKNGYSHIPVMDEGEFRGCSAWALCSSTCCAPRGRGSPRTPPCGSWGNTWKSRPTWKTTPL